MRSSESDIKTGINSEIHASLRRLEDANYVSEMTQAKNLTAVSDQVNSVNSTVSSLRNEIHKLHDYISPHIMNDELKLFQNIYVGHLEVDNGAVITGETKFNSNVVVHGALNAMHGISVHEGGVQCGFVIYQPKDVSVDGTKIGSVLGTHDLDFNLAELVTGSWSGRTYTVKTKKNNTTVASTTVTVEAQHEYNSTIHQYKIWAVLKQGNTTLYTSAITLSGLEAYAAGGEKHKNSVTLVYTGEPYTYRASKDLGTSNKVVYY